MFNPLRYLSRTSAKTLRPAALRVSQLEVRDCPAVIVGTNFDDLIRIVPVGGMTVDVTVQNVLGTQTFRSEAGPGFRIEGKAGYDTLLLPPTNLMPGWVTFSGGDDYDFVGTYGSAASETVSFSPANGGTGSLTIDGELRLLFDPSTDRVHYSDEGGDDTLFTSPSTDTNLAALYSGSGLLTLATYGRAATEEVWLSPAATYDTHESLGRVYFPSSQKSVSFNAGVKVNYDTGGGDDTVYHTVSDSPNDFTVLNQTGTGSPTIAVTGFALPEEVYPVPATASKLGRLNSYLGSFSSAATLLDSIAFDANISFVNFECGPEGDTVFVPVSTTTTFGVLAGGNSILATYGTPGNDAAELTVDADQTTGRVRLGGAYRDTLFKGIGQVHFNGEGGDDTLHADLSFGPATVYFNGGEGSDTLYYRTDITGGLPDSVIPISVEAVVPY